MLAGSVRAAVSLRYLPLHLRIRDRFIVIVNYNMKFRRVNSAPLDTSLYNDPGTMIHLMSRAWITTRKGIEFCAGHTILPGPSVGPRKREQIARRSLPRGVIAMTRDE